MRQAERQHTAMHATGNTEPYLDSAEAAAHLKISVRLLKRLISRRAISFHRLGSRLVRFRRADLDAWAASQRVEAQA